MLKENKNKTTCRSWQEEAQWRTLIGKLNAGASIDRRWEIRGPSRKSKCIERHFARSLLCILPFNKYKTCIAIPLKNKLTCLNLLFRLSFMLKLSCLQRQRARAKVGKAWTFIFGRSLFILLNIVILCTVIIDLGLVSCSVYLTDPAKYNTFLQSRPEAMENQAIELVIKLCTEYRSVVYLLQVLFFLYVINRTDIPVHAWIQTTMAQESCSIACFVRF